MDSRSEFDEVRESSEQERGRRQAIRLFVIVYVLFMITVIVLEAVRAHQLGHGWFG